MTAVLHKMVRRATAAPSTAQLMRLVRFPAIRRAISGALEKAVPEKVAIHSGSSYVRFRLADPRKFHPGLFATIPVGHRGTLLVIGTPKSAVKKPHELSRFIRRMGRGIHTEARRSLIYQLRTAGIIGGSRTQAVLVPRGRVLSAARMYLGSHRAAANPILATIGFNPDAPTAAPAKPAPAPAAPKPAAAPAKPALAPAAKTNRSCRGGLVRSRSGRCVEPLPGARRGGLHGWSKGMAASPRRSLLLSLVRRDGYATIIRRLNWLINISHDEDTRSAARSDMRWLQAKHGGFGRVSHARVAANPGSVAISVPFRDGQKISPSRMRQWIRSLPRNPVTSLICARFEQAMKQYKRFHLGSEPTSFTYRAIPMGSQGKRITDVDVVVSEGKEWAAPYQVPRSSKKYDPRVEGRYIHAHGDSKMEIDIKKATPFKRLPDRFHTADGKFVGVIPGRVKITDWYRR
jgi:hypothetical protein